MQTTSPHAATAHAPAGPRHDYFPAVDGLRTLAVLSVVVFHLGLSWLPGGYTGVDVFFVISGFVVANSVLKADGTRPWHFLGAFYARRILRIMPALLVVVLVTMLMTSMFVPRVWLSGAIHQTGYAAIFGLSNIQLATSNNEYFDPVAEFNPFTHTWSLGVEEQFYLIFPALFLLWLCRGARGRKAFGGLLIGLSLASLAYAAQVSVQAPTWAYYMIFSRFWELGAGVGLAVTRSHWQPRLAGAGTASRLLLPLAGLALLALSFLAADETAFPFPWAIPAVLGSAALIAAALAFPDQAILRGLSTRGMVGIGLRSYSLYLWHWPVIVLMRWTVGIEGPLRVAAAVLLMALLTEFSYRVIEGPIRRWPAVRRAPRGAVILAGLLCMACTLVVTRELHQRKSLLDLSVTADRMTWYPNAKFGQAEGCGFTAGDRTVDGLQVYRIAPACVAPTEDLPTIYVFGDSHAQAYKSMLHLVAAQQRVRIEIFAPAGCGFFRLDKPNAEGSARCSGYTSRAMARVQARIGAGDALFLPALRIPRLAMQWGAATEGDVDTAALEARRPAAIDEAVAYLDRIAGAGAQVILEYPLPLFRSSPVRCSDWFSRMNEACAQGFTVSRTEMEALSASAITALDEIAARTGARAWHPFPVICPEAECHAYDVNGQPFFYDADHLSGYGSRYLLDSFQALYLGS